MENNTETCRTGYYGPPDCQNYCPKNCLESKCDATSGECFDCVGHLTGNNCTDCPAMTYGSHCENKCSRHCMDRLCDANTGRCFNCSQGYSGDNCNQEDADVWMVYVLVVFVVVTVVCFGFCYLIESRRNDGRISTTVQEDVVEVSSLTSDTTVKESKSSLTGSPDGEYSLTESSHR
ncbi:hypothetical protein BsWGS_18435 [Bradybaena similaris]